MKIALAQLDYTTGDIDGNTSKIIQSVERARTEGADLVIFAELSVCGTPCYDLLSKPTFLEKCDEAVEEIAGHCHGICAIVGTPLLTAQGTLSAAAVIADGKVREYVSKKNIAARREMGFLIEGEGAKSIEIAGERFVLVVGDDMRHIRNVDSSASYIISVNSRRYSKDVISRRLTVMRDIAAWEKADVIFVNQLGCNGELIYDGTSGVISKAGDVLLSLGSFKEAFAIFDTCAPCNPRNLGAREMHFIHDRSELDYRAAVLGVRDYFHKNGYEKACVGLSGGIDSSVVACIAAEALGKENVLGLMLPSQFSSEGSVDDAVALAENIGIKYSVLPITEAYKAMLDTMKPIIGGTDFDATEENLQARIRTIMLMALQNKQGYVLLNSSNKSENALGLCTLYGDTAGAFSPTGDLFKTEIYGVARYINRKYGDVIPENILTKAPSSELNPTQKDSDILPPYDVVDAILVRMIEQHLHREEIVNQGFDNDVVEKIHRMLMQGEKKRAQYPPVLRLSSAAFKHEWLLPLVNKYPFL